MKQWWTGLTTTWKIVVVVAFLIIAVFIWDRFTGGISDIKRYLNERAYQERMAKDKEYEDRIKELEAKNAELDKKLVESEMRASILEENDKALSQKTEEELAKLEAALKEQEAVEANTALPTDGYTRCNRLKQKMIELGSETAKEINCETFKQ